VIRPVVVIVVVVAPAATVVVVTIPVATTSEIVPVIEVRANGGHADPDGVLLVGVARWDVTDRHLRLTIVGPTLVAFGACPTTGRRFRPAAARGFLRALRRAGEAAVEPDRVTERA